MAKRGIPVKQITVDIPIYERFRSFSKYGEPNPNLLCLIMDLADKELNRQQQPRKSGKFIHKEV